MTLSHPIPSFLFALNALIALFWDDYCLLLQYLSTQSNTMGKLLKAFGVVGGVIVLIPPVRHHFDQKIFKHIRNYNTTLNQRNRFNTEEEFHEFLGNLGHGLVTFFDTKY